LDDPTRPFAYTVEINNQTYGTGSYLNKKQAKQLAAQATLDMLCPGLYRPNSSETDEESNQV
jgi:microprocessor complex subunit DGCR8